MTLKIEMLRCFATVARRGNLSDAAGVLGRTPSAVSMMLKQLQEHLGEPLFETDRKNKLTALGQFVFEQAENELRQFDNTVHAIEGYARAKHGRVRVATVPSVAGTILPLAIANFLNKFPQVHIEVRDMDSASVLRELSRDRVDIGIASAAASVGTLHCQDLMSDAFGLVCRVDDPLAASSTPVRWEELGTHRFIANELSRLIEAPDFHEIHARATLSAQNVTSLLAMVRANLGVTILPEMTVRLLRAPDIIFRPLAETSTERLIQILKKSDKPASPAARELEREIFAAAAPQSCEHMGGN
jgi:DNA-binding transcriptional LysR family regulator